MKALTLWPEWAAAVVHLGKRVENRGPNSRAMLGRVVGERIALHAGKHVGGRKGLVAFEEADDAIHWTAKTAGHDGIRLLLPNEERTDPERMIGKLDGSGDALEWVHPIVTSALVATAVVGEPHRPSGKPWEQADPEGWCWPLLDVVPFRTPIPLAGKQGLWDTGIRWYRGLLCPLCGVPPKWHQNEGRGHAECQDGRGVSRRWPDIAAEPCEWPGAAIVVRDGLLAWAVPA